MDHSRTANQAAQFVDAAWTAGYFLNQPWSLTSLPWSLLDTYWSVRLAARDGRATGLDPTQVRRWVGPAATGDLEASGLPTVAQVEYGVGILRGLDLGVDVNRVGAVLEGLRDGGRYRTEAGAEADWGSTAEAVDTLRSVDLPVPSAVRTASTRALAELARSSLSPDTALNQALPLLETAVAVGGFDRAAVARLARKIQAAMAPYPRNVLTLGGFASLHEVVAVAGLPAPRHDPAICRPARNPSIVLIPAEIAYYLDVVGCADVPDVDVRAPARAGWLDAGTAPERGALLSSTAAGLVLARGPRYVPGARRWLRSFGSRPSPNPYDDYFRVRLASDLGLRTRTRPWTAPPGRGRVAPRTSLQAMLLAAETTDPRITVVGDVAWLRRYARLLARAGSDANLLDAAALEAIARWARRPDWHRAALRMATTLRRDDGQFRVAPSFPEPTMTGNALGAWVTGTRLEPGDLCRDGVCRESADLPPQDVSLTATALAHMCAVAGCGAQLPFFGQ